MPNENNKGAVPTIVGQVVASFENEPFKIHEFLQYFVMSGGHDKTWRKDACGGPERIGMNSLSMWTLAVPTGLLKDVKCIVLS